MRTKDSFIVNSLLKEQILDFALLKGDKLTFERMTSENWEYYLEKYYIVEEGDKYQDLGIKSPKGEVFLENEFFENFDESMPDLQDYIEETTLTDVFEEKRTTLHQLLVLSRSLNKEVHEFLEKIYNDDELIHLLTIITDKKYRNGVFYMDDETEKLKIKDVRKEIESLSLEDALEHYRTSQETFFLEIKIIKKQTNKG